MVGTEVDRMGWRAVELRTHQHIGTTLRRGQDTCDHIGSHIGHVNNM